MPQRTPGMRDAASNRLGDDGSILNWRVDFWHDSSAVYPADRIWFRCYLLFMDANFYGCELFPVRETQVSNPVVEHRIAA